MLLAKLSTDHIKIHLNLAGIVFEGVSETHGSRIIFNTLFLKIIYFSEKQYIQFYEAY